VSSQSANHALCAMLVIALRTFRRSHPHSRSPSAKQCLTRRRWPTSTSSPSSTPTWPVCLRCKVSTAAHQQSIFLMAHSAPVVRHGTSPRTLCGTPRQCVQRHDECYFSCHQPSARATLRRLCGHGRHAHLALAGRLRPGQPDGSRAAERCRREARARGSVGVGSERKAWIEARRRQAMRKYLRLLPGIRGRTLLPRLVSEHRFNMLRESRYLS